MQGLLEARETQKRSREAFEEKGLSGFFSSMIPRRD
jgi:hypothetical protein